MVCLLPQVAPVESTQIPTPCDNSNHCAGLKLVLAGSSGQKSVSATIVSHSMHLASAFPVAHSELSAEQEQLA